MLPCAHLLAQYLPHLGAQLGFQLCHNLGAHLFFKLRADLGLQLRPQLLPQLVPHLRFPFLRPCHLALLQESPQLHRALNPGPIGFQPILPSLHLSKLEYIPLLPRVAQLVRRFRQCDRRVRQSLRRLPTPSPQCRARSSGSGALVLGRAAGAGTPSLRAPARGTASTAAPSTARQSRRRTACSPASRPATPEARPCFTMSLRPFSRPAPDLCVVSSTMSLGRVELIQPMRHASLIRRPRTWDSSRDCGTARRANPAAEILQRLSRLAAAIWNRPSLRLALCTGPAATRYPPATKRSGTVRYSNSRGLLVEVVGRPDETGTFNQKAAPLRSTPGTTPPSTAVLASRGRQKGVNPAWLESFVVPP